MHAPHYNKRFRLLESQQQQLVIISVVSRSCINHMKYQEGKRIYYQVDSERFNQLFEGLKRYLYVDPF